MPTKYGNRYRVDKSIIYTTYNSMLMIWEKMMKWVIKEITIPNFTKKEIKSKKRLKIIKQNKKF